MAGIIFSRFAHPKASSQMTSPSFATATDMDGISPAAMAPSIVLLTSSKLGFGTVADVGTWPRAAWLWVNRSRKRVAPIPMAFVSLIISDSRNGLAGRG